MDVYRRPRAAPATRVTAWTDPSYIHLGIRFARRPAGRVTVGLDTIAAVTGQPPPGSTDRRADFALVLNPARETGQAWVRDQLNPDQLDHKAGTVGWRNWQAVRYRKRMKPGVSAIRRAFAIVSRGPVSRAARGRASRPAAAAPAGGG